MAFRNLSLRRKLNFFLDSLLFVLFVLSLSPRLTGLPLHEIIGTFLFFPILIHILVEWRWFVNYIGRFLRSSTKRDKVNLILNTLLFVSLVFQIVSGLAISQVLAAWFNIKTINDARWRFWHNQISTVTMFLVGFHLALSVNRILSYFAKKNSPFSNTKSKIKINIKSSLTRIFILLLLVAVVAALSFLILGKPSIRHLYTGNEIGRFHPTLAHGSIQLLGETFLVVLTCFIARRWLKVRL